MNKPVKDSQTLQEESLEILTRLAETNYISLDSQTRRKRLERQATLLAAREVNDPLYIKYEKLSRARRKVREMIQQKYASQGKSKYYEFIQRRNGM